MYVYYRCSCEILSTHSLANSKHTVNLREDEGHVAHEFMVARARAHDRRASQNPKPGEQKSRAPKAVFPHVISTLHMAKASALMESTESCGE
jgi:hypothetical protein